METVLILAIQLAAVAIVYVIADAWLDARASRRNGRIVSDAECTFRGYRG